MEVSWLEARIVAARTRLREAREDRMQVERQMDMADNDDLLILSALMETEAVLANEVGLLLLRKLREKVSAA
jgi:hypothetical protein